MKDLNLPKTLMGKMQHKVENLNYNRNRNERITLK